MLPPYNAPLNYTFTYSRLGPNGRYWFENTVFNSRISIHMTASMKS
jgi:hypothetical protein